MKKLPDFIKWILVLLGFVGIFGLMWAVNDRASKVKMPDPDDTFGAFSRTSAVSTAPTAESDAPTA